eukprot:Clim_evm38s143 gene=Clim_evmTU38s143
MSLVRVAQCTGMLHRSGQSLVAKTGAVALRRQQTVLTQCWSQTRGLSSTVQVQGSGFVRRWTVRLCTAGLVAGMLNSPKFRRGVEDSIVQAERIAMVDYTVFMIVLDYKWNLWRRGTDDKQKMSQLWHELHQRAAERLLALCRHNGGVYIKLGQHVGALDYLLPEEYVNTLRILHDEAPTDSWNEVVRMVESQLPNGKKLNDVFSSFDPVPVGAASLAQVHRAVLRETGETVAVKVQHPLVGRNAYNDIILTDWFAHGVAWLFPDFKFLWVSEEMKLNAPKELNFLHEAENADRLRRMKEDTIPWLRIPRIHWQLSTSKMLVMEFVEGVKFNDAEMMKAIKADPNLLSRRIKELYAQMIFVDGFVHVDPHSGNIMIDVEDPSRIILLDHGMYRDLPDSFRISYAYLWSSLIDGNLKNIKRYSEALGVGELWPLFACIVTGRSWESVQQGVGAPVDAKKNDVMIKQNVGLYVKEIIAVLNDVPRDLLLMLKTNDLIKSLDHQLKPNRWGSSMSKMAVYCKWAVYKHEQVQVRSFTRLWINRLKMWSLYLKIWLYDLTQRFFDLTDSIPVVGQWTRPQVEEWTEDDLEPESIERAAASVQ